MNVEEWLATNLVCPYDRQKLTWTESFGECVSGHRLPVVHGIPVALRHDVGSTHELWRTTAADINRLAADVTAAKAPDAGVVDSFVERALVGTCGNLYRDCPTPLPRYPIPAIHLPDGDGRVFLDVGANWGRWSFAAAQLGYRVIAIDPSLNAALAGTRVAKQLKLPVAFVVGDARHLPFREDTFDVIFSYSVLQHLNKSVVREVLGEVARTSRSGGTIRIQMANVFGVGQLFNHTLRQARSGARALVGKRRAPYNFRVRAWTPNELLRTFSSLLGPATLTADGFFSLNAQPSDAELLRPFAARVVRVSDFLCQLAAKHPSFSRLADSVWLQAVRRNDVRASLST